MDELPADIRAFLTDHPFFQLTDGKKIKCTLNGHELPCSLAELHSFVQGKKYKKLNAEAEFNYSQYEPHIVSSTKQPNRLFCKLTLKHLNRQPDHVLRHVSGKRFKKALSQYEECTRQGIEFVPARLKQKKPKNTGQEMSQSSKRRPNGMWEPSSSEGEHSDSEDSMSDLYPSPMFSLKNPEVESTAGGENEEEEHDFQTDEDEEMEVDTQVVQKRKKVQGGGFQKKFRNNRWKSRNKKHKKAQNGK